MTRWGIHWRNVNPLDSDAWEIAEHFDSFVVMSNMGPELPLAIHERWPEKLIIARLYWPAGDLPQTSIPVHYWEKYIDKVLDICGHFQVLNEPNKEYPGTTPQDFSEWFGEACEELEARFPGRRLRFGFPMPEVTGEDAWQWAVACSDAIQAADFIAEHCYWEQDWQMDDWNWGARYYRCHQQWPDKPIHITEYGSSAEIDGLTKAAQYSHYLREMPEYVGSANAFIMDGTKDWTRFSVTQEMAYVMTFGQGIGQDPSEKRPNLAHSPAYDGQNEGVVMSEADRNRLWADYMAFPAFERFEDQHRDELGEALEAGERTYGGYRVKFFGKAVIFCQIGKWDDIKIAKSKEDLPETI